MNIYLKVFDVFMFLFIFYVPICFSFMLLFNDKIVKTKSHTSVFFFFISRSMSYEKELTVAIQACLQSAKLCERVRSTIPEAIEKVDRSPVTVR